MGVVVSISLTTLLACNLTPTITEATCLHKDCNLFTKCPHPCASCVKLGPHGRIMDEYRRKEIDFIETDPGSVIGTNQ